MAVYKIQTGLRLDEITYGKLKFLANKENRSLNNLADFVLKQYIADYEAKNGTILIETQDN